MSVAVPGEQPVSRSHAQTPGLSGESGGRIAGEPTPPRRDFASVVRALGEESDRGEALVRRAVSGSQGLAPSQLLALQAGIYRYGEVVDLATRLVDRASTGVKSVLQGQ
jgi:hypothetical protein